MTPATSSLVDREALAKIKRKEARRQRRYARRLCAAARAANPKPDRTPSDFGLTSAEILAHGRDLHQNQGWNVAEIRQTLVEPNAVAA